MAEDLRHLINATSDDEEEQIARNVISGDAQIVDNLFIGQIFPSDTVSVSEQADSSEFEPVSVDVSETEVTDELDTSLKTAR